MRRAKQQILPLGLDRRHENPGRPRGKHPRIAHASRDAFPADHPCHVTLRVRPGLPTLRDPDVVREIEAAFRRGNERKQFRLVHYSIQDDHAHLIVEANGTFALGRGMKSIASLFAFAVNRALGRTGRVLADRYHLRVLKSPRQVRNAIAYVLLNARRHAAKRIARLRKVGLKNVAPLGRARGADVYSSGRWFEGWRAGIGNRPAAEPPVAQPRTWFLRKGWRLHGLIDPNEIPASAGT
ncbi:MAG TPA: transposase [Myxococcota bacterium]|nr:transposase [Myxococcota bacterium]